MQVFNPKVDEYLLLGCGRCKFHATPNCKVNTWRSELEILRQIVIETELTEELKWSVPVYTFDSKNILIVSAFKEYCSISFFKGSLLKDDEQLLHQQGESSQSARIFKFTSTEEIFHLTPTIKKYIVEAIENEKNGKKVVFQKNKEAIPVELVEKFNEFPTFEKVFKGLTPSKQRGFIIQISQAKQSATRFSRIEKIMNELLNL